MISIKGNVKAAPHLRSFLLRSGWLGLACALLLALSLTTPLLAADEQSDRLAAIVQVDTIVPHEARTAGGLGTRRTGTGVVIDSEGLVLTVGYLILEAIDVSVKGPDGNSHTANIVAYDHNSGFGLIRTSTPLDVQPLSLGDSSDVGLMDPLLVVSKVDKLEAKGVYLVDRRPFAGYWEYLLEDAIFTAPPHAQFGGAALIDRQGQLIGIGSLVLRDGNPLKRPCPSMARPFPRRISRAHFRDTRRTGWAGSGSRHGGWRSHFGHRRPHRRQSCRFLSGSLAAGRARC